jgi:hypothetical protein
MLDSLFKRPDGQEFEVFQGREQFVTHEFAQVRNANEGDFIDILAGEGLSFRQLLGEEREEYNSLSIDKKILVRFIGTESQKNYLKETKMNRPFFDFRIMPHLQKSSVSTSIRKDNITFQIYGDPVLAFVLKSSEIAANYKNFFEALWDMCKNN